MQQTQTQADRAGPVGPVGGLRGTDSTMTMASWRGLVRRCFLAVFLFCSPPPQDAQPIHALGRMRRSVSHAQLMHDKGRVLQDFKRRMWLQELLDEVHTAEIRDLQTRSGGGAAGGAAGAGGGSSGGGVVVGVQPSTTSSTMHSKSLGGTKNLPLSFRPEEEQEEEVHTHLPQETHKAPVYKDGVLRGPNNKKKKKGRGGRRREGEKRRRRARSLRRRFQEEEQQEKEEAGSGLHLEWSSLLDLQRALQ